MLGAKEGEAHYTDTQALFEWAWEQRGIAPRIVVENAGQPTYDQCETCLGFVE